MWVRLNLLGGCCVCPSPARMSADRARLQGVRGHRGQQRSLVRCAELHAVRQDPGRRDLRQRAGPVWGHYRCPPGLVRADPGSAGPNVAHVLQASSWLGRRISSDTWRGMQRARSPGSATATVSGRGGGLSSAVLVVCLSGHLTLLRMGRSAENWCGTCHAVQYTASSSTCHIGGMPAPHRCVVVDIIAASPGHLVDTLHFTLYTADVSALLHGTRSGCMLSPLRLPSCFAGPGTTAGVTVHTHVLVICV